MNLNLKIFNNKISNYFPYILAIIFIPYWIYFAMEPFSRAIWFVENLPVVIIFLFLVFTFKKFRFSNLAYFLMSISIFWHTVWWHYTFANVPFDFFTEIFWFERNHFDRIGHFAVWLYAYAIAEFLIKTKLAWKILSILFALFAIMAIAAAYEIVEWLFAVIYWWDVWNEFLWSQGDIWDTQIDMFLDTIWAVFSLIIFFFFANHQNYLKNIFNHSR